jgi:hypothetical protein
MIILTACYFSNTSEQNVMFHELTSSAQLRLIFGMTGYPSG